jgi:ferric-dicitrate binding protein FerR (iron transport regulator)
MSGQSAIHLSEEALNDLLIGLASVESEAHLAECAACRAKVQAFGAHLNAFNRASMAWSESRSEALPAIRPAASAKVKSIWTTLAPLEWAVAVAVLLLLALPVWNRNQLPVPVGSVVGTPAAGDSEAQIAEDNDLLKSVDAALNTNDASPIAEYDLIEQPRSHARARPKTRN